MDKKNTNVKYKILNPGGNKTAIVLGNNYNDKEKKGINDKILKENSDVEQVGFISLTENRLEMAGGEFCVNATRCAIWEYLKGKTGEIELYVSGCNGKVIGGINLKKEVYVNMQINKKLNDIVYKNRIFNFVDLDGILLAVVDEKNSQEYIKELKNSQEKAMLELKEIMKSFKQSKQAIGIILTEKINDKIKINPVIWVKTIDTLYYETACGSGSLATVIYMNYTNNVKKVEVIQPSGYSITICLNVANAFLEEAIILGEVKEESII